jgi:hypothetical protein
MNNRPSDETNDAPRGLGCTAVVILRVEVGEKQTTFTKPAPHLPAGVMWQQGCVVDLCDEEYVDVETVVIKEDGSVIVWLERRESFDESILMANGWKK